MNNTSNEVLEKITQVAAKRIPELVQPELKKIILFGSYARGDYTEESDVDIAVLVSCDREGTQKYRNGLVSLSAELDLENLTVVNFICLSYADFMEKKSFYPFYTNIEKEGKVIYG